MMWKLCDLKSLRLAGGAQDTGVPRATPRTSNRRASVNANNMKRYRPSTMYGRDRKRVKLVHEVEQPLRDYLLYELVWNLDKLTYKPWPRSWTTAAWRALDHADQALHVRQTGCQGDCGTWYRRLPTDPPTGRIEFDDEHAEPGCTHHPLSTRWDLTLYNISERNLTTTRTFVDTAEAPNWRKVFDEDRIGR